MKTLLMLGDSLIEWGDWQGRFPQTTVLNLGIAGESVQGLHRRMPLVLQRVETSDGVVLMSGTNNLAMDDFYFVPHYEEIVRSVKERYPEARIALTSLLPVRFSWLPAASLVLSLNTQLQDMCDRRKVIYIDLHKRFLDSMGKGVDPFDDDGAHLNHKGYDIWSQSIREIFAWL